MLSDTHAQVRFQQFGRTCQLRIETPDDLRHVINLDDALWVATSAPAQAFADMPDLVGILDRDGSGRVTSDELREAITALLATLKHYHGITTESDSLDLDAIDENSPEGPALLSAARYILDSRGDADAGRIDLECVTEFLAKLTEQPLNGDGIVVPAAAGDEALAAFLSDAIRCVDSLKDASGRQGVTSEQLEQFREALVGYRDWENRRASDAGRDLLPLGANTFKAFELFKQHADKVDAFFAFHEAKAFAPLALEHSTPQDPDLDRTSLEAVQARLVQEPIAHPQNGGALPLGGQSVNPLYREWLEQLRTTVAAPLLGGDSMALSRKEWEQISETLAPVGAYLDSKQGSRVEALAKATREQYLAGDLFDQAEALVQRDLEISTIRNGARLLKRLILFQKHLLRVANNFVSFSELYATDRSAMFEMGRAVIDGRWFGMALNVTNVAAHSTTAKASGIFTCYLDVFNADGTRKMTVALPATSGSKGNLRIGKRGIFFDNAGREYDAQIVQVIDNPISFREALVAPFVRLWNFVLGKIEAISTSTERDLQSQTGAMLTTPPVADGATAQGGNRMPGGPAGLLVGLSVSAAAIGSSLAFIAKTFAAMSWLKLLGGLGTAALVVMIPTAVIALLKLRRQDLSSLLEGCGWAINANMRLSREQRYQFTRHPPYPAGAEGVPIHRWLMNALILSGLAAVLSLVYLAVVTLRG